MKLPYGVVVTWLIAICVLLGSNSSISASPVTFGKPVAIYGDGDVLNTGTLVYAFNLGGTNQTVNKVLFSAANTGHGSSQVGSGSFTVVAGGDPNSVIAVVDTPTFAGDGEPYNSLSSAYKYLLGSAYYNNSSKGTLTVKFGELKVGTSYIVQFFVNDSRGTDRADTVTSGGLTSDPFMFNTATAPGGVGQSLTATFTADREAQEFVFAPVVGADKGDAQLNAVQLRTTTQAQK